MNPKTAKKISKFLSYVLRHNPDKLGLTTDENGWVFIEKMLAEINKDMDKLTREGLQFIVDTNSKKRFAISEDGTMIRANQGHSIEVDLGYEEQTPPETLFHGTAEKNIDSIMDKGLVKGNRHHVHLSSDTETAKQVGSRHGKPVILEIDAVKMHRSGIKFYRSANGVWLSEAVPAEFLRLLR